MNTSGSLKIHSKEPKKKKPSTLTLTRIEELVSWAKKEGLEYLKVGDIEFRLGPQSKPRSIQTKIKTEGEPSDEEFLFWSAPDNRFEESPEKEPK